MLTSVAHYFEHQEPNWQVPTSLTQTHIIVFVTEGTLTYVVEDKPYRMTKGDIIVIPQGVRRGVQGNDPANGHDMYLFRFRHDGADDGLPLLLSRQPNLIRTSQFEYMKQRFSLVTQHWLRKSAYSSILCHCMLMEIIAHLNEEMDSQIEHGKAYSHYIKLQNYILRHYRRPITVPELAEQIGRTPNYVSTIFRKATGQRITDYIQQIRITAACDMLLYGQMSVREVSDTLGYCEPSYFNKVFKKVTGMQPSTYIHEQDRLFKKR
ncbi:MAG: AraC family transcriptional regulator [Paenibacillus sp.]|jgi:AraC-like DNA-binding protein|nr:AraC family transcriptional regulator [Paenibacillus sp.]